MIAEPGSPFDVQEIGEMVYVKTPFGVTLQWDKNTRVYIRLSTEHMQKVNIILIQKSKISQMQLENYYNFCAS